MSHVLHLVRWDVRRFQFLLLVWVLLVAAGAVLEGAWPAIAVAMEARNTVGLAGNLLAVAEVLFSIALIAMVVQEHPLVGTTAFWMTSSIIPTWPTAIFTRRSISIPGRHWLDRRSRGRPSRLRSNRMSTSPSRSSERIPA